MKLIADREPLLEALTRAARVAPRRDTIPILGHVHLETTRSRLIVTATDMDRELEIALAADVRAPGTITVGAQALRDFVHQSRDGEQVELEIDPKKEGRLVVRAGRARASLATLPAEDFPEFRTLDAPAEFVLDGQTLADALAAVAHAQSDEETRYYLNGVLLRRIAGERGAGGPSRRLDLVATNGHLLARIGLEAEAELPAWPDAIVPRPTVAELAALAAQGGPIAIAIADTLCTFTREGTTIASKLIDGFYPDYERVIPPDQPRGFECQRDELLRAARRCAAIAEADKVGGRPVKVTPVAGARGSLQISARGDLGEITDEIEADVHDAAEVGMSSRYLADILGAMDGAAVRFRYEDAGSPMRLTDPADPRAIHVLMPMRVS